MTRPENDDAVLIEARALARRHGTRLALTGFDLRVRAGEAVALVGANGAGKSTALRLLAMRGHPEGGSLRIDGVNANRGASRLRRRIGLLPQSPPVQPEFSVREGIGFTARLHGLRGPDLERAVDETLTLMDLSSVAHRRAGNLSQGLRQRMALAQTLVHGPDILLLDEPTAGLDPGQAAALRERLQRLRDGRALVIATHLADDLRPLCGRAVVLRPGRPGTTVDLEQGADDVLVRFDGQPEAGRIESLPGVAAARPLHGGYLRLRLAAHPDARRELLAAVSAADWGLREWRPAADALEVLLREHDAGDEAC